MLEETARLAEIAALGVAALGAAIIVYSIIFKRNILVMAAGAVVVAAALVSPMVLRGQPVSIVVVKSKDGAVAIERRNGFYDGVYTSIDGRKVPVSRKRSWGRTV